MIKIAFYGKGGIGKSTTVTNIAVALAQKGYRVLQVGCDPKADSTRFLEAGARQEGAFPESGSDRQDCCQDRRPDLPEQSGAQDGQAFSGFSGVAAMMNDLRNGGRRTVMDFIRTKKPFSPQDVVRAGYAGVLCAEAGGPLPGQGCAGRAVITALEKMEEIGVYDEYNPDYVLYDVLGDVVCGGFAMPMRKGYADTVFILTSGETMSLYAAANIGLALESFRGRGYARLGGIILNRRNVPEEDRRVEELAAELQAEIAGTLSRSSLVQQAEERGQCLLQAFPDSDMAREYREIAAAIEKADGGKTPCFEE